MRVKGNLVLLALSLVTCTSWSSFCQTATNDGGLTQKQLDFWYHPVYSNFPPHDVAWLKSQGWPTIQISNAVWVPWLDEASNDWAQLTNYYHVASFDIYRIGSSNVFVPTSRENQWTIIDYWDWANSNPPSLAPAQPPEQPTNTIKESAKNASINPNLSAADIASLRAQGLDDFQIANWTPSVLSKSPTQAEADKGAGPPELKGAIIYMDSFLGMANQAVGGDVISMSSQALKFSLNGNQFDYSGNYTVILNTPRQHKNPYFGLGSPETAKILTLEDVGGQTFPLPNPTIWEKEANFVDAVSCGKEWIYSGTYSIQAQ